MRVDGGVGNSRRISCIRAAMIPHHAQVRAVSQHDRPPPLIVDSVEQLQVLQDALRGVTRVAFDTESNSLFAYRERVCLIQISLDQADFLLDPLAFDKESLAFLGEVFADPG